MPSTKRRRAKRIKKRTRIEGADIHGTDYYVCGSCRHAWELNNQGYLIRHVKGSLPLYGHVKRKCPVCAIGQENLCHRCNAEIAVVKPYVGEIFQIGEECLKVASDRKMKMLVSQGRMDELEKST